MPHGKLFVVVESAAGIKDPSKHRRGGSYCTLQCGSQVLSTYVVEGGGSHPIFHTEFQFEIDRSTSDLVISVYSTGSEGDDKLVGYTTLDFKTVFFHAHTVPTTAYPLLRHSGRAGGHISISLKFMPRPSPFAHNPHAPMHQYSVPPAHGQNYEVDGYGSSGSESSRSACPLEIMNKRSQLQPKQYYEDHARANNNYKAHHHHPQQAQASPLQAQARPLQAQARPLQAQARPLQAQAHPLQAQARPLQAPAVAHQAMPHRAIPVIRQGAPQLAQRVQYQGMQYQQQGQPGVVAQVAGQVAGRVAQAVAVEVAKQSVQAVAGGFGEMLGGLFGGE